MTVLQAHLAAALTSVVPVIIIFSVMESSQSVLPKKRR